MTTLALMDVRLASLEEAHAGLARTQSFTQLSSRLDAVEVAVHDVREDVMDSDKVKLSRPITKFTRLRTRGRFLRYLC